MLVWCLLALMSGCRTLSEQTANRLAAEAAETPTMELCLNYLTSSGGTPSQRARATGLAQRGETCQAYVGAAQVRATAEAQRERTRAAWGMKGMEMLMHTPRPLAPPTTPRQSTHTFFIDGEPVTCRTMGSMTDCY